MERRKRNINVCAFLLISFFFVLSKIHLNFRGCFMSYASFYVFLNVCCVSFMVRYLLFPFMLFWTGWWRRWWGILWVRTWWRTTSWPEYKRRYLELEKGQLVCLNKEKSTNDPFGHMHSTYLIVWVQAVLSQFQLWVDLANK